MPLTTPDIKNHLSKDPVMSDLISKVDILGDDENVDVFVYMVRSIISQQLSVKSAASIYHRLIDHDDIDPYDPNTFLAMEDDDLRALGLSYQKARYVKNVCNYFLDNGHMDTDWSVYSDDDIIHTLTEIKGVGVWTVQMVLMFALHRPDIFPAGDLGIQQGIAALYDIKAEKKQLLKKMNKISESWSPHRTVACMYIWRFKDAVKEK